jgi:DNA primase
MQEACSIIGKALAGDEELVRLRAESRQKCLKDLLQKSKPERIEPIDDACLEGLDVSHPYMIERGFSEEILKLHHIGYYAGRDSSSFMRGRIVFPMRDIDGKIIGFTGRSLIEDEVKRKQHNIAKWLHSGGLHRHYSLPKRSILYGIDHAVEYVRGGTVILVEGTIDVLRLQDTGVHNACAVLGDRLSRQQEMLIRQMGARVVIPMFDADAAGKKANDNLKSRFSENDILSVRTIDLPDGKDPGDLSKTEIEELLHEFVQLCGHEGIPTGTDGVDEGSGGAVEESLEADAGDSGIPEEEYY